MTLALVNMYPGPAVEVLRDRASLLQQTRHFFAQRNILEVDCCALSRFASIDSHIDAISATVSPHETGFLHTSPEYAMKRLLAAGIGDIYFLGHVFRQGDIGRLHNPEFMMAEWYRIQMPLSDLILEICEFLSLFLGLLPIREIAFHTAFERFAHVNLETATLADLKQAAARFGAMDSVDWEPITYIHFLLTHAVEPHLGRGNLTILTDYPPTEAALACIIEKNGQQVAERFEIYHEGIELANGYHELCNAEELIQRFKKENELRHLQGKEIYRLDESFLAAMHTGLPECSGVSVGFDRAMMLRHQLNTIKEVLPFTWA